MGTTILNESLEKSNIDLGSLKLGDQFINIFPNLKYDMHESSILDDIKQNFVYSFKSIKLIYNVNREAISEITYNEYIDISNTIIKVHDGDTRSDFTNQEVKLFLTKSDFESVKNNDNTTLKLSNEEYIFFCRIPLDDRFLLLMYHVDFSKEFMEKKLYAAIFSNQTNRCFTFDVDNVNQFIDEFINVCPHPAILQFKSEVYDICKYSIDDYLDNKDKTLLGQLFGTTIDKCFKPKFQHDKFAVYLDYLDNKRHIINTYNNKPISFMGPEYTRISNEIDKFYQGETTINPFTGIMENGTIVHDDADGTIYEKVQRDHGYQNNFKYYRTKIYNIYVECIGNEQKDLEDRMQIVEKLTNTY
jgi:hypothetical protein